MAKTYVRINYESIRNKIIKSAQLKGRPIARKKAYDLFYRAREKMMRRFNEDFVTLEIEAGPEYKTKNISGTLDGYGNLFSFLGFNHGDKPIEALRNVLIQKTDWQGSPTFNGKQWIFGVLYPTRKDIEAACLTTPLPWNKELPWIDIIENGAPNLNHYLNLKKRDTTGKSYSWFGFQAAEEVNEDLEFKPRDYITERVLGNFRDTINNSRLQDKA